VRAETGEVVLVPGPVRHGGTPAAASDEALRQAVEELFLRCEARIGRYLAQMVRDRSLAEDLLQDSFQAALRSRSQLPEIGNHEAWLFGIARNRALDALRRRRRFDGVVARLARHEPVSDDDAQRVAVRDLLERTLSPEDRALVILRYLHDFSAVELAEMTGVTPDAVRQRLSRARARLLEAAGPDPAEGRA
jgi:RNA polymerase sigma-70 factor (ECF subfamily)